MNKCIICGIKIPDGKSMCSDCKTGEYMIGTDEKGNLSYCRIA